MSLLPAVFHYDSISFGSETNDYSTDSASLHRNTRSKGGQRWNFSIEFFIRPEDLLAASAFLNKHGRILPITINIPYFTEGAISTQTNVTLPAGSVTCFVNNTAGIKAGQMFKFSSHNKIYQVVEVLTSGTFEFLPALMEPSSSGTTVDFQNCQITSKIASEIPKLNLTSQNDNTYISLDFVEAF